MKLLIFNWLTDITVVSPRGCQLRFVHACLALLCCTSECSQVTGQHTDSSHHNTDLIFCLWLIFVKLVTNEENSHSCICPEHVNIYFITSTHSPIEQCIRHTQPTAPTLHRAGGTPTRIMLLVLVWLLLLLLLLLLFYHNVVSICFQTSCFLTAPGVFAVLTQIWSTPLKFGKLK